MKHIVKLSNGEHIHLLERNGSLSIAVGDGRDEDWFICSIEFNGVLVYPNSGSACECVGSLVEAAE